jgi:hypothetical protein
MNDKIMNKQSNELLIKVIRNTDEWLLPEEGVAIKDKVSPADDI